MGGREGENGGEVGVRDDGRRVEEGHGAEYELLLEHRGCYRNLNVIR